MKALIIIAAFAVFILMIIIHEFGHFASSKLLVIKVNEFSVGMGPVLWKKQKGETQYSVRAFPIGGFCRLEGEDEDSSDPESSQDPRAFNRQPYWKQVIVLFAGSFMNFIMAVVILTCVFTSWGNYTTKLDKVPEGYPAYEAGIRPGDTILAIDGLYSDDWIEICNQIDNNESGEVTVVVERDEQIYEYNCTVLTDDSGDKKIGIQCALSHNILDGIKESFELFSAYLDALDDFFARLVRGKVEADEVSGIVGVAGVVAETASYGLGTVMYLMGMLCYNLCIVNMLPLPALDGGRILFVIIRWITRGKLSQKVEGYIHAVGMVLLMILMVLLVFKDTIALIMK